MMFLLDLLRKKNDRARSLFVNRNRVSIFSMKRPLDSNRDVTTTENAKTKVRRMGICPSEQKVEDIIEEEMSEEKMDVVATAEGEFLCALFEHGLDANVLRTYGSYDYDSQFGLSNDATFRGGVMEGIHVYHH